MYWEQYTGILGGVRWEYTLNGSPDTQSHLGANLELLLHILEREVIFQEVRGIQRAWRKPPKTREERANLHTDINLSSRSTREPWSSEVATLSAVTPYNAAGSWDPNPGFRCCPSCSVRRVQRNIKLNICCPLLVEYYNYNTVTLQHSYFSHIELCNIPMFDKKPE